MDSAEQPHEDADPTRDPTATMPGFADDGLYDLLWQVAARAHLLAEDALADTPLTPASASLLTAIVGEPGMSVADISRRIPKTQQTLSQVVARLQKLGLVERRLREGRGIGLHPTDQGRRLAQEVAERAVRVDEHLHTRLGPARAVELATLLADARRMLNSPDRANP